MCTVVVGHYSGFFYYHLIGGGMARTDRLHARLCHEVSIFSFEVYSALRNVTKLTIIEYRC